MAEPIGFADRQAAQEQIVDQAEDRGVEPDSQRQRDQRKQCETG
jgi:hypothetical protein